MNEKFKNNEIILTEEEYTSDIKRAELKARLEAQKEFLDFLDELINTGYSNGSMFEELLMRKYEELKKAVKKHE